MLPQSGWSQFPSTVRRYVAYSLSAEVLRERDAMRRKKPMKVLIWIVLSTNILLILLFIHLGVFFATREEPSEAELQMWNADLENFNATGAELLSVLSHSGNVELDEASFETLIQAFDLFVEENIRLQERMDHYDQLVLSRSVPPYSARLRWDWILTMMAVALLSLSIARDFIYDPDWKKHEAAEKSRLWEKKLRAEQHALHREQRQLRQAIDEGIKAGLVEREELFAERERVVLAKENQAQGLLETARDDARRLRRDANVQVVALGRREDELERREAHVNEREELAGRLDKTLEQGLALEDRLRQMLLRFDGYAQLVDAENPLSKLIEADQGLHAALAALRDGRDILPL